MSPIMTKLMWFLIWTCVGILLLFANWFYVKVFEDCYLTCLPFAIINNQKVGAFTLFEIYVILKLIK